MTPRASPSVFSPARPPAKRPRLSRSTIRVLNIWDQLAERYNKRLDEDDIVDLYSGTIINDRGVLKNAGKDYDIGHFAPDNIQDDQEQEQEDSERDHDDDVDELDSLPARNASGTEGTMASTSELLRAVPPLSATTDADDLNEFLEAEKVQRELLGDHDGEDDMSMEQLAALREVLHRSEEDEERSDTVEPEDESEDELSIWQHDEASAVYHIARNESEQDVAEGEQKIIELADSDEEFATLLERPPRVSKRKRTSSFSSQCGISSENTPAPDSSPTASSFRFASRMSSENTLVPDTPPAASSSRFAYRMPSKNIVPDTPSAASSSRFGSRTPRTPAHHFVSHPVDPPQRLLYQAMQHLSYALSATMLSYGSPQTPVPPIDPWGTYPPGFAHPWGPQGTSGIPLSFEKLDDDSTLVDDDSTQESGVEEGKRIVVKGRKPDPVSPDPLFKGSTSAKKKKGNVKNK